MPLPFIATLAPRIRALLPIIEGGVARGISSRKLNDVIKAATGQGIRRQTLLDVMRAVSGVQRAGSQLKFLGRNKLPNLNRLPQALTRIQRKYSFLVRVTGHLIESGETIFQHVTLTMDSALTKGRMESMAQEIVEDAKLGYGIAVSQALLISGKQSGLSGTL